MLGQIIKVKKHLCEVNVNGKILVCQVRGNVKKQKPVVGDFVQIDSDYAICKINPRSSYFIRPNCANVDVVNIVIATLPKPDYMVVDRLIAMAINGGAGVVITVNKVDLGQDVANYVLENYTVSVDKIFVCSTLDNSGILELKTYLQNKLVVFAGQSAVGKTSIINAIFNKDFKVGELSKKTQRGKNTTTASTIVESENIKIMDTPGFTSLYALNIKEEELKNCYREFENINCYFADCLHNQEPDCGVKQALEKNNISTERYNRYIQILKEIKEQKYE